MKMFLCCVKSGHDYTEFFESPAGRSRAAYSAPKCFLFISEVADEIRKAGRYGILLPNLIEEIFSLLFADDVVLVLHAPVGLQNQLNVLARASADRASELGQNKSYGLQKREALCSARKMVHKRPASRGREFIRVSGLHVVY